MGQFPGSPVPDGNYSVMLIKLTYTGLLQGPGRGPAMYLHGHNVSVKLIEVKCFS